MAYFAAFVLLIAALLVTRRIHARVLRGRIDALSESLAELCTRHFLVEPCPRCHESEMELVGISPNARSLEYACAHCDKRMRAASASPESVSAVDVHAELESRVEAFARGAGGPAFEPIVSFRTPEAPLPYERTTRSPIAETVRSEVWRRDLGQCVVCGAKEGLEFDHIIPVAKGGASSVRNLQLLCKACNLKKGVSV